MVYGKNTDAMTLVVVCEKNTHAITLVDLYVVCEKNTHPMTLVYPCVVCEKNSHAIALGGSMCGLFRGTDMQ